MFSQNHSSVWLQVSLLFWTSALVAARVGNPPSKKLQVFSNVEYIADPHVLWLADIEAAGVNTAGMVQSSVPVPGTNGQQALKIFTFQNHEDEHVSASVSIYGGWEKNLVGKLCGKWDTPGSHGTNFLDLGANIGVFTLTMAACLKNKGGGEVIAIEANPGIAEYAKAGILSNRLSNVALYPYAVGDPDPRNTMPMSTPVRNQGGSKVGWNGTSGTVSAQLTTMDAILQHNVALQKVLAAKFDIEGSEGRMLNGGSTFFSNYAPCFLITELTPALLEKAGTPYQSVLNKLSQSGYGKQTALPGAPDHYYFEQINLPACISRMSQR